MIKFRCSCKEEVTELSELPCHKKRCLKMQDKYGKLYNAFDEQVETIAKEDNYEEWKNIRVFYEHFRTKFVDLIEGER